MKTRKIQGGTGRRRRGVEVNILLTPAFILAILRT